LSNVAIPCVAPVKPVRPQEMSEGQTPVRTPSNLRRMNTRMNRDDRVGRLIERQRELELDIDLERKARAQLEEEVTRLRVEGETLRAESDKLTAELKGVFARCHDLESERNHLRDELKTAQARLGALAASALHKDHCRRLIARRLVRGRASNASRDCRAHARCGTGGTCPRERAAQCEQYAIQRTRVMAMFVLMLTLLLHAVLALTPAAASGHAGRRERRQRKAGPPLQPRHLCRADPLRLLPRAGAGHEPAGPDLRRFVRLYPPAFVRMGSG